MTQFSSKMTLPRHQTKVEMRFGNTPKVGVERLSLTILAGKSVFSSMSFCVVCSAACFCSKWKDRKRPDY
jgi:hypothetical protein